MSEETKKGNFADYEDALSQAAAVRVELEEIHRASQNRIRKIFEILTNEKSNDFNFVKDLQYYTGGYPTPDSPPKIESFRQQVAAMVRLYGAMGLLDNLKIYFREAGVEIDFCGTDNYSVPLLEVPEKAEKLWSDEFAGGKVPRTNAESLKELMQRALAVQKDICILADRVKIDMAEEVEAQFGITKGAFMKAVEIKTAEQRGKSVDEKIEKIQEAREALDKALEPFTGGQE